MNPASVARLVASSDDVAPLLTDALHANDPLTRATAARVAAVRAERAVIDPLREALNAEQNADAAREEIRAVILLGNDDDIDFATKAASRFPPRMDGVVADSIARLGAPHATDLYAAHVRPLRRIGDESNFFRVALWNTPDLAPAIAAKLLEDNDERGWCELMSAACQLPNETWTASLGSTSAAIRRAAAHALVERYAADRARFPNELRDIALAANEAGGDEAFDRELLRRCAGESAKTNEACTAVRLRDHCALASLFTPDELRLGGCEPPRVVDGKSSSPVAPGQLVFSGLLPPGLSEAIIDGANCDEAAVGLARIQVDRSGRVRQFEASHVTTPKRCLSALATIIGLTFFDPSTISSANADDQIVIVKPPHDAPCTDAMPISTSFGESAARVSSTVSAAVIAKRVEPVISQDLRKSITGSHKFTATVESVVTSSGCVRQMRLVNQTPYAGMNAAALLALSQWKFTSGTRDGEPVPVIMNVNVVFRVR
jgi:hypothetical protein